MNKFKRRIFLPNKIAEQMSTFSRVHCIRLVQSNVPLNSRLCKKLRLKRFSEIKLVTFRAKALSWSKIKTMKKITFLFLFVESYQFNGILNHLLDILMGSIA